MSDNQSNNHQEASTSAKIAEMDGVENVKPAAAEQSNEPVDELTDTDLDRMMVVEEFLQKSKTFMIEYEKHIFLDTVDSDCLVVCAKGISYERVVLNLLKVHSDPANLIIVINAADYEEKFYRSQLDQKFVHESSTNANERELIYLLGGIHFITTRVLVVDLLRQRIPMELITGVIVLRAHQVVESCQEAFVLRLYRQNNKTGFVKAFTNSAEAFTYGYGHIEKVMRNIFARELFIWPRYHALVRNTMKQFEPTVIELHVPMTRKMTAIQSHLLDIMNLLVKDVKRINRFVDMQEVTVENCVTKRFHKILQAQLDSVWHQLNGQTKLLISDLKVLRSLMISTMYNDSIAVYATMKRYRTQEYAMNNSGWILFDAAEQIFKLTRERVYNDKDEFDPEYCPKWGTLSEILRVEIPADTKKRIEVDPKAANEPVVVLILCQDTRTCYQLNQYLLQGPERYLLFTAMKNDVPIHKLSAAYNSVKESDAHNIRLHGSQLKNDTIQPAAAPMSTSKSRSKKESLGRPSKHSSNKPEAETDDLGDDGDDPENTAKQPDELTALMAEDVTDFALYRESYVLICTGESGDANHDDSVDKQNTSYDISQMSTCQFETFNELENLDITQIIQQQNKPIVCIQTFKTGDDGPLSLERTLHELNPRYVILYHCNVMAVRQIEVFEARKQRALINRLKVFFMIHAQTVEEQSYLTSLRREKQAFDLIIDTKAKMVVPKHQDGKSDDSTIKFQKVVDVVANTRQAGGQQIDETVVPKIIVDIREFRSELPCLIHHRGIEVAPVTITVGDYILTPNICVERKSISDLIGSLNSGRLYTQCVQMTRFYKTAILLIEFDQNKPFHLQGHYIISGETTVSNMDIIQKLQLLTIHFPKLRIVWSPSPYATAQLFDELKQGKPQPDPAQAVALGSDESTKDIDNIIDKLNPSIYDFLLKLPGITTRNVARIMTKVKNMKELIKYDLKQLTELLDSESNAKMLWEIVHETHKPVEVDVADKPFQSKYRSHKNRHF